MKGRSGEFGSHVGMMGKALVIEEKLSFLAVWKDWASGDEVEVEGRSMWERDRWRGDKDAGEE